MYAGPLQLADGQPINNPGESGGWASWQFNKRALQRSPYRQCRRHAAIAAAATNSNSTVPGSGTAAGAPETGAPAGTDAFSAGLDA